MNYQIVDLKEKTISGIACRTSCSNASVMQIISSLWQKFFQTGIYKSIENKMNGCSIRMYSNYADDGYTVTVCCEVGEYSEVSDEIITSKIPSGKYAKFIVNGHEQRAVLEFWTKLWDMGLDRSYICDFEEYQVGQDKENCEIHIYVSLN